MSEDILKDEIEAFNLQIKTRVENGHIPDLRRSQRCEYFYNNVWRDQEFADLYFGEVVNRVKNSSVKYLNKTPKEIKILEVGCGPGHISLELAREGFNVVGIDIASNCIEVAKKTAKDDPWIDGRGDLHYFEEEFMKHTGDYDVILFSASLHHFSNSQKVIKHADKCLGNKGIIIVDEPVRDLVSERNSAVILLIKGLLSASGAYFEDVPLLSDNNKLMNVIKQITINDKYQNEDGNNIQSPNDNESGFHEMYPALTTHFNELEFKQDYAFYHQIIGGIRLKSKKKEHELARFLKTIDSLLCDLKTIDPTNFYFIGGKK